VPAFAASRFLSGAPVVPRLVVSGAVFGAAYAGVLLAFRVLAVEELQLIRRHLNPWARSTARL
jgi:hypothetical protein